MANVTITQLPVAGPIQGTESVPIVQNGQTVQTTTAAIAAAPSQFQTFLTVNQESTLPNSRYVSTGTGLGIVDDGAQSFFRLTLNGASGSLETALTGIVAKDSSSSVVARTITAGSSGILITDGNGVAGNPTIALSGTALSLANLSSTGMLSIGEGSVNARVLTGTANQIDVANANGTGNPTFSIASNPIIPGAGAMVLPVGNTASRPVGINGMIRYNSETSAFEFYEDGAWTNIATSSGVTAIYTGTGLTGGPITSAGTISIDSTVVTLSDSQILTNKTISGASNTLVNIGNNSLIDSAIAIGDTSVSLGGIVTTLSGLTSVTLTQDPTSALQVTTKQYVDALASGVNFHAACNYASTAALPAYTYNNGIGGIGATITANANGALVLDGHTFVAPTDVGLRVLIKNEPSLGGLDAYNGVYTVTQVGNGSNPFILTRATDYDSAGAGPNEINAGDLFLVLSGATLANTSWVQQTPLPITVGTTALTFVQFAKPIVYNAGTGLTESPSYTFNIANTGVSAATYGAASKTLTLAINAQGQITSASASDIAINGNQITSGTVAVANGGTGLSSGTSGGVLYYSATGTLASSAALAASSIVLGGGAGVAPSTTTTGTGVVTAVGNAVNTTGGIVTQSGTLAASALLLGGGASTAISSTTTGTGVVTAVGNAVNTTGGLVTQSGTLAASSLLLGGGASTAISSTTTGTGVVTALGTNVGTAGAFVVNGGALGTPSSGTVTNLTGTASININGTVGATTANTGAFTSVTSTSASGILTRAAATQDGVELIGRAGGTLSYKVSFTPTTLSASRTLTLPDASGTIVTLENAQTFTADNIFRSTGGVRVETATLNDAVVIVGRAGGAPNGRSVSLTPTTLTASRTLTLPDASGTILQSGTAVTVAQGGTGITTGTSGGIPYFSAASTIASSAALAASALVIGGGAGVAPSTTTTGTGVITALGNAVNTTGGVATINGTATLTNKRIDPRVTSAASAASLTPDVSVADMYAYTALAVNLTIAAPIGTPVDGDKLMFRILDNGTSRTLTWNATFTAIGVTIPTATTISKMTYVSCIYNAANTRWDVIAVTTQA